MINNDELKNGVQIPQVLDSLKKTILSAIYVSNITNETVFQILNQKKIFSDEVNLKFEELVKENLIHQNKKTLTKKGRNSLKVVLAGGVFDIIHPGHIHTLKDAKALGDVLVVVVATDNTSVKMKKRRPLHDQEQRRELVNSLSMVDLCLVGQEEDIFKTVDLVRPQVIALGYDQTHQEKFIIDGCKRIKLDAKVARLESPMPESSSSKIQKEYGKSIHGI